MNKIPLFRSTIGLCNKIDAVREPYDPETFVVGLYKAENVVYDATGAIKIRPGFSKIRNGVISDLFSCGRYGVCVKDDYLYVVNEDLSLTSLNIPIHGKVAYESIFDGVYDVIYFTDGVITGLIRNKQYYAWAPQAYVGNPSTQSRTQELLTYVPPGHLLHIFNGRMYIAFDNLMFVSEPLAYAWYDPALAYVFESAVTMIQHVSAGLLVSTGTEVFLMLGNSPEDFAKVPLLDKCVIKGSDVRIPASDLSNGVGRGAGVLFAVSDKGIYFCDENGTLSALTEDKVAFASATKAATIFLNTKQYITSLT